MKETLAQWGQLRQMVKKVVPEMKFFTLERRSSGKAHKA
jgi:hypothetical protein